MDQAAYSSVFAICWRRTVISSKFDQLVYRQVHFVIVKRMQKHCLKFGNSPGDRL